MANSHNIHSKIEEAGRLITPETTVDFGAINLKVDDLTVDEGATVTGNMDIVGDVGFTAGFLAGAASVNEIAAGGTLSIGTADALTVGGTVVGTSECLSFNIPLHASKVIYNLFVSRDTNWTVTHIDYTPDIAQGGALTATVVLAAGTDTPASATTPMHTAAGINLNGTAHTVQAITAGMANLVVAPGSRIALVLSGAMTVGSGCLSIRMKRTV